MATISFTSAVASLTLPFGARWFAFGQRKDTERLRHAVKTSSKKAMETRRLIRIRRPQQNDVGAGRFDPLLQKRADGAEVGHVIRCKSAAAEVEVREDHRYVRA